MTNRLEDTWPIEAQEEIKRLRSESARYRIQRNAARQECNALRAELEARGNCGERSLVKR